MAVLCIVAWSCLSSPPTRAIERLRASGRVVVSKSTSCPGAAGVPVPYRTQRACFIHLLGHSLHAATRHNRGHVRGRATHPRRPGHCLPLPFHSPETPTLFHTSPPLHTLPPVHALLQVAARGHSRQSRRSARTVGSWGPPLPRPPPCASWGRCRPPRLPTVSWGPCRRWAPPSGRTACRTTG